MKSNAIYRIFDESQDNSSGETAETFEKQFASCREIWYILKTESDQDDEMIFKPSIITVPISCAVILCLAGCKSPFATRTPEPPETEQTIWTAARSPEEVFENLAAAISDRNADHYIRSFVDVIYANQTFHFIPEQEVQNRYPDLFTQWDLTKERTVMDQVFQAISSDSVCSLVLSDPINEVSGGDSVITLREYTLRLHHQLPGIPTLFEGRVEFRLLEDQRGEWVIYHWTDYRLTEDAEPWSVLKAALGG